ncbi:ubiquinol-cytochrome c reductase iron-sulfur subunit [Acetobacter orientalis]|uniref:ubiquinol-cytochrome c reductase iron-sulfur subunit n=1 Tax=Acetobacter orientalis TaxID=146474 RepID=UPI0039EA0831
MDKTPPSPPKTPEHTPTGQEPYRRDFLGMVTTAGAVTGAAACAIPFLESLKPQDSASAHAPVDVDLSKLAPGQQTTVVWQGKPVFILRRTPEDIAKLQNAAQADTLRDPSSKEHQQPPYAENWHRSLTPEYGVYVGICTHLGCVPAYAPAAAGNVPAPAPEGAGKPISQETPPGGYACPCHGSKFDLAGRVFKGAPAPYNLPVPPYFMPTPTTLRLGENPKGQSFDFSTIVQI